MPPLKRKRAEEDKVDHEEEEEKEFQEGLINDVPAGPMVSILELAADTDSLRMVLRCVCKRWAVLLAPKDNRCIVSSFFPKKEQVPEKKFPVTSLLFDASKRGYSSLCIKAAKWRPGIARFPMAIVGAALCEAAFHGHAQTCRIISGPKVRTRWILTQTMANAMVRSAGCGGNEEASLLALKWGGNPDCLLNGAARGGHLEICKLAAAKGGSLNRRAQVVVVLSAAKSGHASVVEWLIDTLGYSVYSNEELLRIAGVNGRVEVCRLVKKWEEESYPGFSMSPLWASVMMESGACGGHLHICEKGAEWGACRFDTTFWNAAVHGHEAICRFAIENDEAIGRFAIKNDVGGDETIESIDEFSQDQAELIVMSKSNCPHGFTPSEAVSVIKLAKRLLFSL